MRRSKAKRRNKKRRVRRRKNGVGLFVSIEVL